MFGGFSTTRSKKKTDEIIEVITPPEDKDSQWDLNDDGKLDEKELTHLKRADASKLERYLEADVDGDGVLSNNELRLAEEGEDQFARLKTLRKIKEAYVFRRNKKRDYMSLFLFSVFLGLYLGILYEQTEATSAYGIVWTMQNSIVPQNENTDEDQLVYSSKDNVFDVAQRDLRSHLGRPEMRRRRVFAADGVSGLRQVRMHRRLRAVSRGVSLDAPHRRSTLVQG